MAGRRLRLLAIALLLGGCSTAAEVTGTATQHDLVQIRADVASLQASARQLKAQADGLGPQVDGRLRDQATDLERQANALGGRLDGLATSVTGLSSRVDELTMRLETLSRQLGVAPRPPSSSVVPPPAPGTVSPAPSGTPPQTATAPVTPMAPPPPRPTTGALQPEDIYQAAYIDFSKGAYQLAITNFREFIRRFPDHKLAGNAQYWVGEAHFSLARGYTDGAQAERAQEELGKAIQEFRKVVANYPRGEKTPAALYKEALALIELKQPQVAQARLQYLVDNFPQAEETPMARERLTVLKDR
jgi:tol-pal system protein YbgF